MSEEDTAPVDGPGGELPEGSPVGGDELANPYGFSPERLARREAALRNIRQFGDPALKMRAQPVEEFDGALKREVEWMTHLMEEAYAAGLAANQIGQLRRVFVYHPDPE